MSWFLFSLAFLSSCLNFGNAFFKHFYFFANWISLVAFSLFFSTLFWTFCLLSSSVLWNFFLSFPFFCTSSRVNSVKLQHFLPIYKKLYLEIYLLYISPQCKNFKWDYENLWDLVSLTIPSWIISLIICCLTS